MSASPLHAARAGATCAYCAALGALALATEHPLVLAGALVAVLAAAALAGAWRAVAPAARFGAVLAVLIALVNALLVHHGLTVLLRLGTLPVLGRMDVTAEGLAYGGILGLRVLVLVLCAALWGAAVDHDEVLRLFRRLSFHSALTASLATRMVPVLRRDAQRLADAQRCRPDGGASRLGIVRAVATGALDRSVDVAAALELRGYGSARRPGRSAMRPWSRHDVSVAAAAVALAALAALGALAPFQAYPRLHLGLGAGVVAAAAAAPVCALVPLLSRRGVRRR